MKAGHALHAFGQPSLAQPPSLPITDLDVVMILGPVMAHEHQLQPLPPPRSTSTSTYEPEVTSSSLMVQCSHRHVIPPVVPVHLTDQQAHDLGLEPDVLHPPVLTCWQLGNQPHSPSEQGGRSPLAPSARQPTPGQSLLMRLKLG
jgi:hypothetical protein